MAVTFVLNGCLITEVDQPSQVAAGGTFTATITVSNATAEPNPHKGVLVVLVPEDWTFTSGTYSTSVGSGTMALNPDAPVYGDIDTIIAPPAGMKWVDLLSSEGYAHPANLVMETTINFHVGNTGGTFPIGYAATKNTVDMMTSFNTQEIDNDFAWTDTSMQHMVTVTGASSADEQVSGFPSEYKLSQNYPNPFNPSTGFTYSLKESGNVEITVYDASGKEVRQLVNGFRAAGNYSVHFDAGDLTSGIYFYKIATNNFVKTNKMLLLK